MTVKWCRCVVSGCGAVAELVGEFVERMPDGSVDHHYVIRCAMGHDESPLAELVKLDAD